MNTTADYLREMQLNTGESLDNLSDKSPVLLVFLRHFGCTFCREAMADLAKRRKSMEENGMQLVFVHMADNETAERYFNRYDLAGVAHISDPDCEYYIKFRLAKGNFRQLFGLQSWMRGFSAGVVQGHGIGAQLGDGFQMPGVFVIKNGKIIEKFIHKLSSDRPDYDKLVRCCSVVG